MSGLQGVHVLWRVAALGRHLPSAHTYWVRSFPALSQQQDRAPGRLMGLQQVRFPPVFSPAPDLQWVGDHCGLAL